SPNTGLKSIPHACQYNCSPIMPNRFFKEVSGYSAICPRVVIPIRYKFLSILEPMPQIFLTGKGHSIVSTSSYLHSAIPFETFFACKSMTTFAKNLLSPIQTQHVIHKV